MEKGLGVRKQQEGGGMTQPTKCLLCDPQKKGMPWPSKFIDGLKFLMDNGLLCADHSSKVRAQIKEPEREPGEEG